MVGWAKGDKDAQSTSSAENEILLIRCLQIPRGFFVDCPIDAPRLDIMAVEYMACNLISIIVG
jgi:hypothetical protein